ncbi:MAG: LacI family DNA-binding transcriptional regulator, partial [Lentisphaeria bacterium]
EKIQAAADTLGYRANRNARALVTQTSMTVGVYVAPHPGDRITSLYVSPILEGICEAARENFYDVLLIDVGTPDQDLRRSLEKYHTKRVDGVILVNFNGDVKTISSIQAAGLPAVGIDSFGGLPLPCVNLDNGAGIQAVVAHLHQLGHRRLAFLGEQGDSPIRDHGLRQQAFLAAVRQFGMAATCQVVAREQTGLALRREGPFCQEDGYRGVDWLLAQGRPFTALVGYNDLVALGALRRLTEAGLRVPAEVSLTGFDDTFVGAYLSPPLTTVSHPVKQMGKTAVRILLETVAHPKSKPAVKPLLARPELVVRASTGPVPSAAVS